MNSYDEVFYKYVDYYRQSIKGNKIAEKKSQILWNELPTGYQTALLEMRCHVPNCSKEQYSHMLVELRTSMFNNGGKLVRCIQSVKQNKYHDRNIEIR